VSDAEVRSIILRRTLLSHWTQVPGRVPQLSDFMAKLTLQIPALRI
jgi:hypothetical protein